MKLDLAGKIKNTRLQRSKALLPLFEAVVNSFQAIEDAGPPDSPFAIQIIVERDRTLPEVDGDGPVNSFTIIDNGVGFNQVNFDAFLTSDTQIKLVRGGKGLGRFIWLKAFQFAHVESHFYENGSIHKRVFRFSLADDHPVAPSMPSEATNPSTSVRLGNMITPYKEACLQNIELIGHSLIEHYLPFFIDKN